MEEFYKNEIEFNNRDIQELNNRTLYISVRNTNNESRNLFLVIIQSIFNFFLRFLSRIF